MRFMAQKFDSDYKKIGSEIRLTCMEHGHKEVGI